MVREKFLDCMKMIYPQGSNQMSAYQLKTLVKVFFMGWCECLIALDNKEKLGEILEEYKTTSDYNWWPGNEWKW